MLTRHTGCKSRFNGTKVLRPPQKKNPKRKNALGCMELLPQLRLPETGRRDVGGWGAAPSPLPNTNRVAQPQCASRVSVKRRGVVLCRTVVIRIDLRPRGQRFRSGGAALARASRLRERVNAALERRLGARLINRSTRKLLLTAGGHAFLERAHRVLADLAEAERAVTTRAVPRGLVRINCNVPFGLHRLCRWSHGSQQPILDSEETAHRVVSQESEATRRAKSQTLPHRNAALQEEGTDLIDNAGALADQSLAYPV